MSTVTIEGTLKSDSQGYVSNECPGCDRRFKTKPSDEGNPPSIAHCPFCDHDGTDCWFTTEQVEYMKGLALAKVVGPELDKLDRAMRGLERSGGALTVKVTRKGGAPKVPPAPIERDDDLPAITNFTCCSETVRHDAGVKPSRCMICAAPVP